MKTQNLSLDQNTEEGYSSESVRFLLETIQGINRTFELREVLQKSIEAAQILMNAEASSLMLIDEHTGELYVSLPTGPVKEKIKGRRIPAFSGIGGWVAEHKKPLISNNLADSDIFYGDLDDDFETQNIICLPLINDNDKVIGVVQALNRESGEDFTSKDISVFKALASQITISIDRARQQEKMQEELKEKEILLTEIHHRIKNNLATISALIEIEGEKVEDSNAQHILDNTHSRINSMIEVHDLLCSKGILDDIDLGVYLSKLSGKISNTLSDPNLKVDILLNADTVHLSANKALLCGMIVNELLVNIYKHAFQDVEVGTIDIELSRQEDSLACLKVSDNGIGMPADIDFENHSSVGTWVVGTLLKKLDAEVEIKSEEGTSFYIYFEP